MSNEWTEKSLFPTYGQLTQYYDLKKLDDRASNYIFWKVVCMLQDGRTLDLQYGGLEEALAQLTLEISFPRTYWLEKI